MNAPNTSLRTESKLQDRNALHPSFEHLYPEGTKELRKAWTDTTVRPVLEHYSKHLALFDQAKQFYEVESGEAGTRNSTGFQSIGGLIFAENMRMYEKAFEQQHHFSVFCAWVMLREQETRNI